MQIGLVGLGKMGGGIARRLCRADIHVVGYDTVAGVAEALAGEPGFAAAYSVDSLLLALKAPRVVWAMLPAGEPTGRLMEALLAKLAPAHRGALVVPGMKRRIAAWWPLPRARVDRLTGRSAVHGAIIDTGFNVAARFQV